MKIENLVHEIILLDSAGFKHVTYESQGQHAIHWYSQEAQYRHSLIYSVNVGTHKKNTGNEKQVNGGYSVVLKGRKIG